MFWPLEKVPTTMPLLLTATDCSWPAAKPFWVMPLIVAAPLELANCVSAPVVTFIVRLPSAWLSTDTFEMLMAVPGGDDSAPFAPKVKTVPVFVHAGAPLVELVLDW